MTLFSLTAARLTDHRNPHGLVRVTCGGGLDTRPRFLSLVHESVEVSDDWRCGGVQSDWYVGSTFLAHANAPFGSPTMEPSDAIFFHNETEELRRE